MEGAKLSILDVRCKDAQARPSKAEAKAEGAALALLTILRIRGIAVSDSDHARIAAAHDLPTLERWLKRAATSTSIAAVFDD